MQELLQLDESPQSRFREERRARFKSLSTVSNVRGFLKLAAIIVGLGLSFLLARAPLHGQPFDVTRISLLVSAVLVSVWTQHAIAEEVHDGVHLRVLSNARKNDLLCSVYACLLGVSFAGFRRDHLMHHKYFGCPRDPDYSKYSKAPRGGREWIRYFGFYFSGLAAIRRLLDGSKSPEAARSYSTGSIVRQHPLGTTTAQLCLFGAGTMLVNPAWYLVCWIGPLVTLTYGITQFRTMLEHWSPDQWADPKTGEPRAGALFNLEGRFERNLLAAQFGYNNHGIHHVLPAVPNTSLKNAAEYMRDYPISGHTPIQTMTYAARIAEVFRG